MPTHRKETSDGIERRCDDCGVILRPPTTRRWRCPRCGNLGGALAVDPLQRRLRILRVVSYPSSALPASGLTAVGLGLLIGHVLLNGDAAGRGWGTSTSLALLSAAVLVLVYISYLINWLWSRRSFIAASREREELQAMPTVTSLKDRVRRHVIELLAERDHLMSRRKGIHAEAAASRRSDVSRSDLSSDIEHIDRDLLGQSRRLVQLVLSHEELKLLELLIILDGLSARPLSPPAGRQRLSELPERAARLRLDFEDLTLRAGFAKAVKALKGTPVAPADDADYGTVDPTEMLLMRDKWENFNMALGHAEATMLPGGDRPLSETTDAPRVLEGRQMDPYRGARRSASHQPEPVLLPVEMGLRAAQYRMDSMMRPDGVQPVTTEALRVRNGLRVASEASLLHTMSAPEDLEYEAELDADRALEGRRPREISGARAARST